MSPSPADYLIGRGDAGADGRVVVALGLAAEGQVQGAVRAAVAAAAVAADGVLAAVVAAEPLAQVLHLHRQVRVHAAQVRADAAQLLGVLRMKLAYSFKS